MVGTQQFPNQNLERLARNSTWNRKKGLIESVYNHRDEYGVKAVRDLTDLLIAVFREENDIADGVTVIRNQAKIELLKELKIGIETGRSRLL